MKMLAKADILENNRKHKAGAEFETDNATGLVLLEYGWAVEVAVPETAVETADIKPRRKKKA
jgi:hypothetical protein